MSTAIGRLILHPPYRVRFDAAWNQTQIQPASQRPFNPRHLMDALRAAPTDRRDVDAVTAWLERPLKRYFPHTRCVGLYGEFTPGRVAIKHRLAIGYEHDQIQRLEDWARASTRNCFTHWLQTRRPLLIDADDPPAFATPADIALLRSNKPGAVAAHGIVDPKTGAGSFFAFAGVMKPLGPAHVQALDLIVPILNSLQLDLVAEETASGHDKLEALTPRQREMVALILAGRDNGGIATAMRVSEKTVRNNVSEAYSRLGVASRAELFTSLRG